ncbi:MAG: preprotein translocase subunit SecE [Clostridiales bacterium]|nr:preprotein translocase subunit SecE [Clostridiales bacterium]
MSEEKKAVSASASKKPRRSFLEGIKKWFRELKAEIKKIVWASRKQVANNTLVVIGAVLSVGVFIWIIDFIFAYGRDILISTIG